tara:strand:- start:1348 stop:2223 length:876 start_codon:yes stop_codon:yes gene_type:complete
MEFKNGFKIKPHKVSEDGVITFTDGTNTGINPSGVACKAYGYDYRDGLCRAFVPSVNISKIGNSQTNNIKGKNTVPYNVNNSIVQGDNIEFTGYNNNIIANGKNHQINSRVSNSTILAGRGGTLQAHGQTILTSHAPHKANVGECSVVILNCNTTDNTTTSMLAQIEQSKVSGVLTDFIPVPNNSIVGIELYLTRLELGGASGTAGNFSYRRQQSVIRVDQNGSPTITNFNTKNIAKLGVNGSFAITGATLPNDDGDNQFAISVNVSDRNNVNNSWSGIMYLHILSTNVNF